MLRVIDRGDPDPHDAVAHDAALLAEVDERRTDTETLLFWESRRLAVVIGSSGVIDREVDRRACMEDDVPILRRVSGGGAVVVGPGCLNYTLILSLDRRPELRDVAFSYRVILGRIADALQAPGLNVHDTADLALHGRKVSGNAQRRGRITLLHHGTFLYRFNSSVMERYLSEPERRPHYRGRRAHRAFVTDLPNSADEIKQALVDVSALFGRDVFK